jgi:multidrug efflux pump subunit AcrA (membrane-fusion protein)
MAYLVVGLAVVLGLRQSGRLTGHSSLILAWLFWPAYLPVCLSSEGSPTTTGPPTFTQLAQRLKELPLEPVRREEYGQTLGRIEQALLAREAELLRLEEVRARLHALGAQVGREQQPVITTELTRVETARARLAADVAQARAQVVALAVRLEILAVRAPKEPFLDHLNAFEEDLDRLLSAQEEVERLG